jgi:hypothetical protein
VRLARPVLRVRWRVPFRTLRSYSLVALLVLAAGRARVRCIPDRQPDPHPAVVDCGRCDPFFACACRLAAETLVIETITRVQR